MTLLITFVIFGGIQSISKVATKIVPFMASVYILICLLIVINFFDKRPATFILILKSAFNPTAAFGGFLGSTVL